MKMFRNSIFVVLAIVCATAVATPGAELNVSCDPSGLAIATALGAPQGSFVEAVADMGGASCVVDMAPVDGGMAMLVFPVGSTNQSVVLRDGGGNVLNYQGELDFD